jgi:L-ascorbate metabolism protein UlaG (beta-lactamase superfamily)
MNTPSTNERGFHEEGSEEVGFVVKKGQTKYLVAGDTQNCSKSRAIETGR